MRFNDSVVMFDFCEIPMVGNSANGYAIGLTGDGAEVCRRMLSEDVPTEEVAAVDAALLEHLSHGGFFMDGAYGVDGSDCGSGDGNSLDGNSSASADAIKARNFQGKEPVQSAYLHVTQRCNLNCRGCYSLDEKRNNLADACLEDICHAIDELASAGVQQLIISGGEPFLRSDLSEIVRHAKEDCSIGRVVVLSNGTCITPDALSKIAPYVDGVSVSFDGWSADCEPYIRLEQRFDELVRAIRMIQDAGIPAHMIPTAHAKNIAELPRYMELAKELGVTMNFSLLTCEPDDPELGELLPDEDALKLLARCLLSMGGGAPSLAMDAPVGMSLTVKRGCGAGVRSLSVDADGMIYPCHMLHRPELAMGNAFTGSVSGALEGEVGSQMNALCVEDCDGCNECRFEYICGGGCRARSLYATDDLHSRDSYCAMICEFYDMLGAHMKASLQKT